MTLPAAASDALNRLERFGVRLGLDRIHGLLDRLDHPHLRVPIVLIAGTNGKGSTAALLASIAAAAGYRVGLYTSPHIEEVEERLRINGRAINGERFAEILLEVLEAGETGLSATPTYFEALTATAFCYFAREEVDLAVMEVGLGGRLDATNVGQPTLSLITDIALDHQRQLGESVDLIAREKGGILRSGRPALAWVENPAAARSLASVAGELGAKLNWAQQIVSATLVRSLGWTAEGVRLQTPRRDYELTLPLLGDHQVKNLGLAVLAAETLGDGGWKGFGPEAVARGVRDCRWPGRLEMVALPHSRPVLLDGAHNAAGARALAAYLDRRSQGFDLLFGALADKDFGSILSPLACRARRIFLTAPRSNRAAPAECLAPHAPAQKSVVEADLGRALDRALEAEAPVLLACGSLYLVGDVRVELRARFGEPQPAVEIATG